MQDNVLFRVSLYVFSEFHNLFVIGPLTETHLPIDSLTKKLKGFAFVTYMIPEHAVRAFSSLDGTCFMVGPNDEVEFSNILCNLP